MIWIMTVGIDSKFAIVLEYENPRFHIPKIWQNLEVVCSLLGHFMTHKPLISEEWTKYIVTYVNSDLYYITQCQSTAPKQLALD